MMEEPGTDFKVLLVRQLDYSKSLIPEDVSALIPYRFSGVVKLLAHNNPDMMGQLSDRNVKASLVNADFSAEDNILSQMDLRMNRQLLLITHRMNGEEVFRRKRHDLS